MNTWETIVTAGIVIVAAVAVAKYMFHSLRAEEPDCGSCEKCPAHTRQGCCTAQRGNRA